MVVTNEYVSRVPDELMPVLYDTLLSFPSGKTWKAESSRGWLDFMRPRGEGMKEIDAALERLTASTTGLQFAHDQYVNAINSTNVDLRSNGVGELWNFRNSNVIAEGFRQGFATYTAAVDTVREDLQAVDARCEAWQNAPKRKLGTARAQAVTGLRDRVRGELAELNRCIQGWQAPLQTFLAKTRNVGEFVVAGLKGGLTESQIEAGLAGHRRPRVTTAPGVPSAPGAFNIGHASSADISHANRGSPQTRGPIGSRPRTPVPTRPSQQGQGNAL
jgi:hypothetical protein